LILLNFSAAILAMYAGLYAKYARPASDTERQRLDLPDAGAARV
jgi:hypothetical protein